MPQFALSLQQPWAWAVLHGAKDVENRTWPTAYRGPLLIHAAQSAPGYAEDAAWITATFGLAVPQLADLPRGAIVGAVELVDCMRRSPSRWAFGPWCFVLANPRPCAPLPLRGMPGIWDCTAALDLAQRMAERRTTAALF